MSLVRQLKLMFCTPRFLGFCHLFWFSMMWWVTVTQKTFTSQPAVPSMSKEKLFVQFLLLASSTWYLILFKRRETQKTINLYKIFPSSRRALKRERVKWAKIQNAFYWLKFLCKKDTILYSIAETMVKSDRKFKGQVIEQDSKMFAVIHKKKRNQSITGIINISLSCRRHSMKALQTLALIN